MFIRFVSTRKNILDGSQEGIFQTAFSVVRDPVTPFFDAQSIGDHLEWFSLHLELPDRFSRSRPKGAHWRKTRGLSWFKPSATGHISRAFALTDLLKENGCFIRLLRTQRPGFIVYEDEFQIVAEPFAETRV
jgi:hypothetical protein